MPLQNSDYPYKRLTGIEVDNEETVVTLDRSLINCLNDTDDDPKYYIWVWGDERVGFLNDVYVYHQKYIDGVPPCLQRRYDSWTIAVSAKKYTPYQNNYLFHHKWMQVSQSIYDKEEEERMAIVHSQRKKKYHKSLLVLRWAISENTSSGRDCQDVARYILSFIYTKQYGI